MIENFPVGRRLAFDARKGRLWVICLHCRRWNLSPLEERWEAIETCEKLYAGTTLRASTDNIGMARLADSMDVVRIGAPKLPEMATWRYAWNFRSRWLVRGLPTAMLAGGGIHGLTQAAAGAQNQIAAVAIVASIVAVISVATNRASRARVALPSGKVIGVSLRRGQRIALKSVDRAWALDVSSLKGGSVLAAADATPVLRALMTARNFTGAPKDSVVAATDLLARGGDPDAFIARVARASQRTGIHAYPPDLALALEMALHERSERQAIEGDLAELRAEWELAEGIAKIADDMFLPDPLGQRHAQLVATRLP